MLMILSGAPGASLTPFPSPASGRGAKVPCGNRLGYSSGTSSSATILMILIKGLIAGPAVSL